MLQIYYIYNFLIPQKYFHVMFPNLCQSPFNTPWIWKYSFLPKNSVELWSLLYFHIKNNWD